MRRISTALSSTLLLILAMNISAIAQERDLRVLNVNVFREDPATVIGRIRGILTPPVDTQAAAAGMVRLGDSSEVLADFPNTIFAVNRRWAESHRASIVGFLRAWLAAKQWILTNTDEATHLVSEELKVSPKLAAIMIADLSATGAINPAALDRALALRNQFGLTPKMGPAVSRYYDIEYYKAAAGQ
jgi:ABC-type nitrate/sulfonate/bicarbonate transport system substrate-binding protein